MANPVADVDVVSLVRAHLLADSDVTTALGGADRVGGRNAPPFPRVLLTDPPGGDARGMRWLVEQPVQVSTYGDPDGSTGKAALAAAHRVVVASIFALPEVTPAAGTPTVTWVSGDIGGFQPEPTGQHRYLSVLRLTLHPGT